MSIDTTVVVEETTHRNNKLSSEGAKLASPRSANDNNTETKPYSPRRAESLSAKSPDIQDAAALSKASRSTASSTTTTNDYSYRRNSNRGTDTNNSNDTTTSTRSSYTNSTSTSQRRRE